MMNKPFPEFGFVIISPEFNIGRINSTAKSLKNNFPDVPFICCVPKNAVDVQEIKEICPVHKGKDTITSLINTGLKKGHKKWNLLIFEGSWVREGAAKKLFHFIESEKDILFPIVVQYDPMGKPTNSHTNFVDGSLNGLLIHQSAIKEVGEFIDGPLDVSKTMWGLSAMDKGYKFKAILGVKVF